jgi:hypothetical protein
MKRIGVIDLGIGKEVEILSDLEKRTVVAGNGNGTSWDCMFNMGVI